MLILAMTKAILFNLCCFYRLVLLPASNKVTNLLK